METRPISEKLLVHLVMFLAFTTEALGASGLEMIGVSGPSSVHEGETITLTCRYDLGRDAIYSMKWYKNKEEIYRYVPTDNPEYKTFPTPGIEIDSASTRPNQLVTRITGPLASGQYKCEITVETPSFVTLHRSHNLTVVSPPKLAPKITGIDSNYRIGDLVEVFCTSKDSKPAASLNWRINGKPAPRSDLVPEKITLNDSSGLETSQLGLRFTATESHFTDGELRLICGAEIEGVWKTHVEGVALGGGARTEADVAARSGLQEAKSARDLTQPNHLLVRNQASKNFHSNGLDLGLFFWLGVMMHLSA